MLMASRKGEEIRRKVEEIGGATHQAVKEGGVSRLELDSLITYLTSHLNQLLQLSCLISSSSYNIPVHYATTATHLRQVKLRFNSQTHLQNPNIYFHEFPTPPFLSPPPNPNSSFKFPSHLQPSFDASIQLRDPVAGLLREISNTATRVVVIHDSLMAYVVQDIATIPNAESYIFSPVSAFNMYLPRFAGKGNEQ
ncbi:hypothetical protein RHGRI_010535 [Rhododendron griersonianum]|uniref:Glycosyltransferase N-terminal domain-containing protein n=1 Tax=Rhododendron griersonianum TaxID=479676 RepID=A0AAV6KJG5_9ERIC|nr:hypothetical protein RHGRI_010535 [Rhododendron griersonianum]